MAGSILAKITAIPNAHARAFAGILSAAWLTGLHPKIRRTAARYGCQRAPVVRGGNVILVEVSKLPRETRKPKKLWLWWHGEGEADLDFLWRAYVRRFDLEHTIRFLKQTLGWTTPRLRVTGTFA
jgi:hypothetical protein